MNKFLKIIVSLVQIGGGLFGLGLIGRCFLKDRLTQTAVTFHVIFIFVFSFGIIAGLALIIKPRLGLMLSAIFQAFQIPVVTGSSVVYVLFSGACFNIYKYASGWGFKFFLGSHYSLYFNSGQQWLVGINVFALIIFILLIMEIRFLKSLEKPRESQTGRSYPARRFSQAQPHMDNSSPLRHIYH
jgi:hypothetical protein